MAPPRKFDRTEAIRLFAQGLSKRAISRALGVDKGAILFGFRQEGIDTTEDAARWVHQHDGTAVPVTLSSPPSLDEPIEALIDRKIQMGRRVEARQAHGEYHVVSIADGKPVGILHMGDWHLDDDGNAFTRFLADVETVLSTPGLYCGLIGDLQNNWIGRLARLHAHQSVTARDSWRLVEHYVRLLGPRLVYVVLGNHDVWSGSGDPMHMIARSLPCPTMPHEVRIRFVLPGGTEFRAAMRHEWPGNSVYHSLQGQVRAHRFGLHDDLVVGGHKHTSGYARAFNANTGALSHLIQLGSYKVPDDFAAAKGFEATNHTPSVVTVFRPGAGMQGRVQVFERDEKEGHAAAVEYLQALRSGSSKPAG